MRSALLRVWLKFPSWVNVLLFLILVRIVLNIPALIGANLFTSREGVPPKALVADPSALPGIWARWDSAYYTEIALKGYVVQGSAYELEGPTVAFFPAYPFLMRLFAFGLPLLALWSGFLISNAAIVLASLLLWYLVMLEFNGSIAWGSIITLNLFPTSFFFSAIYTESLFFLLSILVYWCSVRKKYFLAGLIVTAASLTRINGVLLSLIPVIEILIDKPSRVWLRVALLVATSGIGLSIWGLYLWITQGSPLAFVLAHEAGWKRLVVWPWQTLWDSVAVVISGYGGFENDWFMRVTSLEDLLTTILFITCTVLAFSLIRRSLFAYSVAAILLFLVSHGPYTFGLWSMSRLVLGLFPGFIVLGILISRIHRLKWLVWSVSSTLLSFLTVWFASGRWVA